MSSRLLCLSALLLTIPTLAQESRATLSGRVVDPSDAPVTHAKVKAINQDTSVATTAETNESGVFRILYLLPGNYRVTVEKEGFKTYLRDNIELRVNDSVDLTLQLAVGNVTETVSVKPEAPVLETADASTGAVIDERRLTELPQRGGNPLELERLTPGAVRSRTSCAP